MPNIQFDRFYRYDDLTRLVHEFAAEYPQLAKSNPLAKATLAVTCGC